MPDLEAELALVTLPSGASLMREGEPSDALYMVLSGRLRIVTHGADGTERIRTKWDTRGPSVQ